MNSERGACTFAFGGNQLTITFKEFGDSGRGIERLVSGLSYASKLERMFPLFGEHGPGVTG